MHKSKKITFTTCMQTFRNVAARVKELKIMYNYFIRLGKKSTE